MKCWTQGGRVVICAAAIAACGVARGGEIDPPVGPVAPTMKTLVEVEPRIAVNDLPGSASATHIISASGSYYLTGNITGESGKDGIQISADDVTLDLCGFAVIGVAGSVDGIDAPVARRNVAVLNGSVRNWGGDGVRLTNATNSSITSVRAYLNTGNGLRLGSGGQVRGCLAESNGGVGIVTNLGVLITECVARSNSSHGFSPGGSATISNCIAQSNVGQGFAPGGSSLIENCTSNGNEEGYRISLNTVLRNSQSDLNIAAAIHATGNDNRIEGNYCARSAIGLDIDGTRNYVAGNTVRGNTDNYDIGSGNQLNLLLGQIPETIDWPANVLLAGTLTGASGQSGITINANDVTIDLGGHALVGVPGSLSGIRWGLPDLANIVIRNGTVRNWGEGGVNIPFVIGYRFEGLNVSDNVQSGIYGGHNGVILNCTSEGNSEYGILTQLGGLISNCTARNNGVVGIVAANRSSIVDSVAYANDGDGIVTTVHCSVSRCDSHNNAGDGIRAGGSSRVSECNVAANGGDGIEIREVPYGALIDRCVVSQNVGHGIIILEGTTLVEGCTIQENGLSGVYVDLGVGCRIVNNVCSDNGAVDGMSSGILSSVSATRTHIEGNTVVNNPSGVRVLGTGAMVIANRASGNGTAFSIPAGNAFGPIFNVSGVGNIASVAGSDHPQANLTY